MQPRAAVAFAFALASFAVGKHAFAIDVQQCLAASEKGQRARSAGRLREAREAFQTCGQDGCPSIVRSDCTKWRDEVQGIGPTVVFGARDAKGHDLFDVTVSMDNEVIAKKLDGKAVSVDPGPHTFKLESPGFAPVTEKALVKEGEKARVINVTFADPNAGATTPAAAATPEPITGPRDTRMDPRGGHTILPWIVVGVGAATLVTGVVILLAAPSRPPNCNKGTSTCVRLPGETADEFSKDQEQAGKSDSQPVLGGIVAGVGAAIVAGGLVWHFLEPTDGKSGLRASPWTTGNAGGLTLGGSF